MASDKKNANPEFPDAPTGEQRCGREVIFWFAVFDNSGIKLIQILKVCA